MTIKTRLSDLFSAGLKPARCSDDQKNAVGLQAGQNAATAYSAYRLPAYALVITSAAFFTQAYTPPAEIPPVTPQQIFVATNAARLHAGLSALQLDPKLMRAAQQRASDMAEKKYFAHTSPDGLKPWDWLTRNGYAFSRAAENLAINFQDTNALIQAWLASPEHKKNLLNPLYQDVGVYVQSFTAGGRRYTVIVELYGTPPTFAMR